jgi:putative proteasome-type protease
MVYENDAKSMKDSEINFDVSFLFGGQIAGRSLRLFMIYAAGNFIECTTDTPYLQIGEHKYGKPILDRAVTTKRSLRRVEDRPDLDGFDHAFEPCGRYCRSILP